MFAAKALHELKRDGPVFIKRYIATFAMESMIEAIERDYNVNRNNLTERWRTANAPFAERTRFMILGPSLRDNVRDNPIHWEVAKRMWDPNSAISFLNFEGWGRIVEVAMAWTDNDNNINSDVIRNYFDRQWLPLVRTHDPRWNGVVTESVALGQLEQIIIWVANFLKTGHATQASQAHELESHIAQILYDTEYIVEGETRRLIDQNLWSHVLPAQLGNGAVSGFVFDKLGDPSASVTPAINELLDAAGVTSRNECPRIGTTGSWGGSLVDSAMIHSRTLNGISDTSLVRAPPEASCALNRFQSGDPDATSDTTPLLNFESKFTSTQMKFLLETFTTGRALEHSPLEVEGSEKISRVFWGSQEMRGGRTDVISEFWSAARAINVSMRRSESFIKVEQALIKKRNATHWIPKATSSTERSRQVAIKDDAILDHDRAVREFANDGVNSPCAEFGRWFGPRVDSDDQIEFEDAGITCLQILDLAWWFDFLAREYIFNRRFVWRASLSSSSVVSSSTRFSGPFLTVTTKALLEDGLEDNLYRFLFNKKYSPLGPVNDEDVTEWEKTKAGSMTSDAVALGSAIPSRRDRLVRRNGQTDLELWDQTSPVQGSHSRFQIAPVLKRKIDSEEPAASIEIWMKKVERTARFDFSGDRVDGPGGMELLRYRLIDMATAFNQLESDKIDDFGCALSLHSLPAVADGKRSNILLKVSQPYLHRCGNQALSRDYDWTGQTRPGNDDLESYLDFDQRFGQAISGRIRLAEYLFWAPSRWFASLQPTLGMFLIREERRDVNRAEASSWSSWISHQNNLIDNILPGVGFSGAFISVSLGILFLILFNRRRTLHRLRKTAVSKNRSKIVVDNSAELQRQRLEKIREKAKQTLPQCKSRQMLIRSQFKDEHFAEDLERDKKAAEELNAYPQIELESKQLHDCNDSNEETKRIEEIRKANRRKKVERLKQRINDKPKSTDGGHQLEETNASFDKRVGWEDKASVKKQIPTTTTRGPDKSIAKNPVGSAKVAPDSAINNTESDSATTDSDTEKNS